MESSGRGGDAADLAGAVHAAAEVVIQNLVGQTIRGEDETDATLRLVAEAEARGVSEHAVVRAGTLLTTGLHAQCLPEAEYDELIAMAGRSDRACPYLRVLLQRIVRGTL